MISGIIALLIADSGVQTLVGMGMNSTYKIFPVKAPSLEKRPYVIVRRIANPPLEYKSAPTDAEKGHFSVVVYAENYGQCEEISEAVRTCLDGTRSGDYKMIWFNTAEDLFDPMDGNAGSVVINNLYRAWVTR